MLETIQRATKQNMGSGHAPQCAGWEAEEKTQHLHIPANVGRHPGNIAQPGQEFNTQAAVFLLPICTSSHCLGGGIGLNEHWPCLASANLAGRARVRYNRIGHVKFGQMRIWMPHAKSKTSKLEHRPKMLLAQQRHQLLHGDYGRMKPQHTHSACDSTCYREFL